MQVEFEIQKDILQKIIKSHRIFIERSEKTSLSYVHFELVQDVLKVSTTDGVRCLLSAIKVNNLSKPDITFNIDAMQFQKMVIYGSSSFNICITVTEESAIFTDKGNGTVQAYKLKKYIYPNIEKIINNYNYGDKNHSISLNKDFFKDLAILFEDKKPSIIELNIHKEDNCKPLVIKAGTKELKQTAILMPHN